MTVGDVLAEGVRALASSESARIDAQLLLAQALGQRKEWLISHDDAPVAPEPLAIYRRLCNERSSGKPIAYILGTAWFFGREFIVNEHVLIPRPETEHLVEDAITHLASCGDTALALDVGVGSGAIACTIAAEVAHTRVEATDVSHHALAVATQNAQRLNVASRIRFYEGDLTSPLDPAERYDVIVANLPYVPSNDIGRAPEGVSYEPRLALDGGPDGLDPYRRLLPALPALLKPRALVLLEAAPPTIAGLAALAGQTFEESSVAVTRDYGGRERYVSVRRPSTGSG